MDEKLDPRKVELLDIDNIMSNEGGRRFIWRLLEHSCTFSKTFNKESSLTSFNEGRRSEGLWLTEDLIENSTDKYLLMMKENLNE